MYYSDRFPTEHCPQICTLQQRMHVAFPPPEIWDLEAKMELNWNQFRTLVLNESTAVWYCTGMWSRKTSWLVCLALPIRRSFTWWSANGIMLMIVSVRLKWSKWNYDMRDNILSTKFQKHPRWTLAWRHPSKIPTAATCIALSKICSLARQGTPSSCSKAILE